LSTTTRDHRCPYQLSGLPALLAALAAGSVFGYAAALPELRAQRTALARARHAATHDDLTGLPNRAVAMRLLDRTRPALVGVCDVDGLKTVNDAFGHDAGDQLLRVVACRLRAAMAGDGIAARLGGDEFALIWHHQPADSAAAARAVLDHLCAPARIAGRALTPSASLGIAAGGHLRGASLLAAADHAMYQAKHTGQQLGVYNPAAPPPPLRRVASRRRDRTAEPEQPQPRPAVNGIAPNGTAPPIATPARAAPVN
jgi:diguanylate cyclase (GGDEF)-like protein